MGRRFAKTGIELLLHIEPGSLWENGYAKSFRRQLREEFLNLRGFSDLRVAGALTAA